MGLDGLLDYYKTLDAIDIRKNFNLKISEIMLGDLNDLPAVSKRYFTLCHAARDNQELGKSEIDNYMLKYSQAVSYLVDKELKEIK